MWLFPLFITAVVKMNEADEENSSMVLKIKVAWQNVLGMIKLLSQHSSVLPELRGVCWGGERHPNNDICISASSPHPSAWCIKHCFLQMPAPINLFILEKTKTNNWEFIVCAIRKKKKNKIPRKKNSNRLGPTAGLNPSHRQFLGANHCVCVNVK